MLLILLTLLTSFLPTLVLSNPVPVSVSPVTPAPPQFRFLFTVNLQTRPLMGPLVVGPAGIRLDLPITGGTFMGRGGLSGQFPPSRSTPFRTIVPSDHLVRRTNRYDPWRWCRPTNDRSSNWDRFRGRKMDHLTSTYTINERIRFVDLRFDEWSNAETRRVEPSSLEDHLGNWRESFYLSFVDRP